MTAHAHESPGSRHLTCARCGTTFGCGLSATCWCAAESVRLPMPAEAEEDCICPACLRHRVATNGS